MKYTPLVITILLMMLRFTFIMAQTSDCQKKCEEAFIKCSGACAKSTDTACGAGCIKDRDACAKNCGTPVKPKPAPDIDKGSHDADDADDDGDVEDDSDSDDSTDDIDNDADTPDVNEDDL
jgi:hypothetical protein